MNTRQVVPPGDHTAAGDVAATGECARILMARAGEGRRG